MTPTRAAWPLLALLVLSLGAGCGDAGSTAGREPAPTEEATTPPPPPLPTLARPSGPPSRPTDVFTPTTVTGVVVAAAEGCVEVESDVGVRWSLLGPLVTGLEVGRRVTVSGRSRPEGAASACTGVPFVVDAVG